MLVSLFWVAFGLIGLSHGQEECTDASNQPITTCDRCLLYPECVWCSRQTSPDLPAVGCVKRGSYDCQGATVEPGSTETTVQNETLGQNPRVQIAPQRINAILTPNRDVQLDFVVGLAEVAVDIYFVMDLSYSMRDHQRNLVNAAGEIAAQVKNLTSDYRLGFGSFSDKPIPPFSANAQFYESKRNIRPPPYSFQHQLSLTNNISLFETSVRNAPLASNVDSPESGMDALMQTITCGRNVIGWRDEVRKVIIFITDQDTHYAMDGKLGGIVRPQDGQCSTKRKNNVFTYERELELDYPSFGQLRDHLQDKNMVIIFAVRNYVDTIYRELSKFLQGTENIGHLTDNPTSLRQIVVDQYRAIKSRIVLNVESTDRDNIEVTLQSSCQNPSEDHTVCSDVLEKDVVHYVANIRLKEGACSGRKKQHEVNINLAGFAKDTLTVRIQCQECNCGRPQFNSNVCGYNGHLVCGGCQCEQGHSGKACECAKKDLGQIMDLSEEKCQQKVPDGPVCFGRGKCVCGRCDCPSEFLGQFCQCERATCPGRDQATVGNSGLKQDCSGHGTCKCTEDGKTLCSCDKGYSGSDCSCPEDTKLCVDIHTKKECFGRGRCECGRCFCDPGFEGKYCQRSKAISTCEKIEPCVTARLIKSLGPNSDDGEYYQRLCDKNTMVDDIRLFGHFVQESCLIQVPGSDGQTNENLIYIADEAQQNCTLTMEKYEKQKGSTKTSESRRGDQAILRDEEFKVSFLGTGGMTRCIGSYDRCQFLFFHGKVESDQYFTVGGSKMLYLASRKLNNTWHSLTDCSPLPLALILGSSMGVLFLIGLALIVAAIVIINLNDLRKWQQYQAWKAENEARLGEHRNPLYQAKATTIQNPAFGE